MEGHSSNPLDGYYTSNSQKASSLIPNPFMVISKNEKFKEYKGGEREIVQGGHLCLNSIQGTELLDLLSHQHLLNFVSKDLPIRKEMVEWFYRNVSISVDFRKALGEKIIFEATYPPPYSTLVYNDEDLLNDFGLVGEGELCGYFSMWPSDKGVVNKHGFGDERLTSLYLNRNNTKMGNGVFSADTEYVSGQELILDKILRKSLLPTTNEDNKCSRQSTLLLFMIIGRRMVNWPFVITHHLLECGRNRKCDHLPYGGLITHIMTGWKMNIPSTTLIESMLLNSDYFRSTLGVFRACTRYVRFNDRNSLTSKEQKAFDEETASFGLKRGVDYEASEESDGNDEEDDIWVKEDYEETTSQTVQERSSHPKNMFKKFFGKGSSSSR